MKIRKIGLISVVFCLVLASISFASSPYIDAFTRCSVHPIVPYLTKVQFEGEAQSTPASETRYFSSTYTTYQNAAIIENITYMDHGKEDKYRQYSSTYFGENYDTMKIDSHVFATDHDGTPETDSDSDSYFIGY